ncbi:hypothetical protein [Nocardia sp. NPDC058497]|uniref:hypothetical protein n=1 Tax=Nocardia sp. NPDC058497 TaxID=3346529 RepID=UPI00364EFB7E
MNAGQRSGEWWQTPGTGAMYGPQVAGYAQQAVDAGNPGVQSSGRRSRQPGVLLDRAVVAFTGVLAGYAVLASVLGFKANTLFADSEWMSHRILAVTAAHLVVALLWLVAAVLLGRRVKSGRALVGVLAVGYLGMNSVGLATSWWYVESALSVFTGSVDYVCLATDWYGCPTSEDAGLWFTGAGAVLAALMLILMLVFAETTRTPGRQSPQVPSGFGGQPPHGPTPGGYPNGQLTPYPGPPLPHHPYR